MRCAAAGLWATAAWTAVLCSFDIRGFITWEYTNGTYDREGFLWAAEGIQRAGFVSAPGA